MKFVSVLFLILFLCGCQKGHVGIEPTEGSPELQGKHIHNSSSTARATGRKLIAAPSIIFSRVKLTNNRIDSFLGVGFLNAHATNLSAFTLNIQGISSRAIAPWRDGFIYSSRASQSQYGIESVGILDLSRNTVIIHAHPIAALASSPDFKWIAFMDSMAQVYAFQPTEGADDPQLFQLRFSDLLPREIDFVGPSSFEVSGKSKTGPLTEVFSFEVKPSFVEKRAAKSLVVAINGEFAEINSPLGGTPVTVRISDVQVSSETLNQILCPVWVNGNLFYGGFKKGQALIFKAVPSEEGLKISVFARPQRSNEGYICPRATHSEED